MISSIANGVRCNYEPTDENGFRQDYRKPVYDFLGDLQNVDGLKEGEIILLDDNQIEPYYIIDSGNDKYGFVIGNNFFYASYLIGNGRAKELIKVLKLSEFINRKGTNDLKKALISIYKNVYSSSPDRHYIINSMRKGETYSKYRQIYKEAMTEYRRTAEDFYETDKCRRINHEKSIIYGENMSFRAKYPINQSNLSMQKNTFSQEVFTNKKDDKTEYYE